MTLNSGLDSAYPPTLQQAQAARLAGYLWWGFYLPRIPNTDPLNGWTPAQVSILTQAGIKPVPICVPSPPALADPIQTATEYFTLAKQQYGLNIQTTILYNGEHIRASGPVWLPQWGSEPTAVGPQSAIQWTTGTFAGLGVDFNTSAPDFPADRGLVCDLEHNVTYTPEWYATFQQTVSKLMTPTAPTPIPEPSDTSGGSALYVPSLNQMHYFLGTEHWIYSYPNGPWVKEKLP